MAHKNWWNRNRFAYPSNLSNRLRNNCAIGMYFYKRFPMGKLAKQIYVGRIERRKINLFRYFAQRNFYFTTRYINKYFRKIEKCNTRPGWFNLFFFIQCWVATTIGWRR